MPPMCPCTAGRFRILPGAVDALVRAARRGLRPGVGAQRPAARADRRGHATSHRTSRPDGPAGAGVRGVSISDAKDLEPGAARRGQGRVSGQPAEPAVCGDHIEPRGMAGPAVVRATVLCARRDGLVHGLRRLALAGTEWANAPVASIRTRRLKIGAVVRVSVRRVRVSLATAYPWQAMFRTVWAALRCREASRLSG